MADYERNGNTQVVFLNPFYIQVTNSWKFISTILNQKIQKDVIPETVQNLNCIDNILSNNLGINQTNSKRYKVAIINTRKPYSYS